MRITDDGGEDDSSSKQKPSKIFDNLKRQTTVAASDAPPEQGKIVAEVNSSKLKQMLANIKQK